MTTELEKQFFDTFGIEHEERYYNCKDNLEGKCGIKCFCECCDKSEEVYCYPQITDKQYLELICIIADNMSCFKVTGVKDKKLPCSELKKGILYLLINSQNENIGLLTTTKKEDIKHQVQAIFGSNQ